jgi:hypothetical protein
MLGRAAGALGERLQFEPNNLGIDLNAAREGSKPQSTPAMTFSRPTKLDKIQDTVDDEFRMLHRNSYRLSAAGVVPKARKRRKRKPKPSEASNKGERSRAPFAKNSLIIALTGNPGRVVEGSAKCLSE